MPSAAGTACRSPASVDPPGRRSPRLRGRRRPRDAVAPTRNRSGGASSGERRCPSYDQCPRPTSEYPPPWGSRYPTDRCPSYDQRRCRDRSVPAARDPVRRTRDAAPCRRRGHDRRRAVSAACVEASSSPRISRRAARGAPIRSPGGAPFPHTPGSPHLPPGNGHVPGRHGEPVGPGRGSRENGDAQRAKRGNAEAPAYLAASSSSSSIRMSWLYLATRSDRAGAPVLI